MKRRTFIAALGGAAAWPLVARGQTARRIGMLIGYAEDDVETQARLAAFRKRLDELGWAEGRNLLIDYRFAPANPDQAQRFAKELIALRPDVLVGNSTPATAALLSETDSAPIVFVGVSDPVGSGFVASIARPHRNITGFTNFEPSPYRQVARNPQGSGSWYRAGSGYIQPQNRSRRWIILPQCVRSDCALTGVRPITGKVGDAAELEEVITTIGREPGGSLIIMPDAFDTVHRQLIILLATRYGLPAIYPYRYQAVDGGLMAYGVDTVDLMRRAALYVDRIFKGEIPADLPVQAPTKYELVINLNAAKALGLTIPPSILARADEVIEWSGGSSSQPLAARRRGRWWRAHKERTVFQRLAFFGTRQAQRKKLRILVH